MDLTKTKYLDLAGLQAVWAKINDKFATKAELVDDLAKLDGISAGAQVNVIEGIAVAGVSDTTATPVTEVVGKTAVIRMETDLNSLPDTEATPLRAASAKAVKDYVDNKVNNKNVTAQGDSLVSATAADNKVTVAATADLSSAVANANSALQSVAAGDFVTVTTKASNAQTIGVTVVNVADAATTADGLAKASDVKSYVAGQFEAKDAANASTYLTQDQITTGSANGTISVKGSDVVVKGLGSAAFTEAAAYATSAQGDKADSALQSVAGSTYVTVTDKANNTQTISLSMGTVDGDAAVAGVAEATNVRSYVDDQISAVRSLVTASTQFLGVVEDKSTVTGMSAGDIVAVVKEGSADNGKEFIYDGENWIELGDVTAEQKRLTALEGRADALEGRASTLEGRADALEGRADALEGRASDLEAADVAINGRIDDVAAAVEKVGGDFAAADTKIREDFAAADVTTLNSANAYTDSKIVADAEANSPEGGMGKSFRLVTSVVADGKVSPKYFMFESISQSDIDEICA